MESEQHRYAPVEYQELEFDSNFQLVACKGKLFQYKAIGGALVSGRSLQQILGKLWNKEIKRMCAGALQQGMSSQKIFENYNSGQNIALMFRCRPMVQNGEICGLSLTISDVSVQQRIQQQQELRIRMKTISEFAGQFVHKINNPVAAALNRIGGLLVDDEKNHDPALLLQSLHQVQEQLYYMSLITTGLAAFCQSNKIEHKLVQTNSVILNTLHLMRLLDTKRQIYFKAHLDPTLPRVLGSAVTLEQCFVNICKNAMEAMPDGGTLRITTQMDEKSPDFISITFTDTGSGLSPEMLRHAFDPFYTTKKDHHGLGLCVCFAVISTHDGSIYISSQENIGSTVQIIVPIAKVELA